MASDICKYLVAKETRVAVADGVVESAAHGVVEGAIPLLCVIGDECVSWGSGRGGDGAGVDENTDHKRDFVLRNQVVNDGQDVVIAAGLDVSLAILEDHQSCWNVGVIPRWHVDPVFTLHAVVDL